MAKTKLFSAPKRDGDSGKRFPNSLSAFVRCVFSRWKTVKYGELGFEGSAQAFVTQTNFPSFYLDTFKRFPAARNPKGISRTPSNELKIEPKSLAQALQELGRGDKELHYYQLRALADYLGVSDSAVLVFGMLTSVDRRVDEPEQRCAAMTEFLDAMQRTLDKLREQVATVAEGQSSFSQIDGVTRDGKEVWVANAEKLHEVIEAYNDGPLDTLKAANAKK